MATHQHLSLLCPRQGLFTWECLHGVSRKILACALEQAPLHKAGCALEMSCLGQGVLTPKPVMSPPGAPGAPNTAQPRDGDPWGSWHAPCPGCTTGTVAGASEASAEPVWNSIPYLSLQRGFLGGGRCCREQEGSGGSGQLQLGPASKAVGKSCT